MIFKSDLGICTTLWKQQNTWLALFKLLLRKLIIWILSTAKTYKTLESMACRSETYPKQTNQQLIQKWTFQWKN